MGLVRRAYVGFLDFLWNTIEFTCGSPRNVNRPSDVCGARACQCGNSIGFSGVSGDYSTTFSVLVVDPE